MTACAAVDRAMIGQRVYWMRCTLPYDHDGFAHYDAKRNYHWNGPWITWDDFEHSRTTKAGAVPKARKVKKCPKCGLAFVAVGTSEFCICRDAKLTGRQGNMFAVERSEKFRAESHEMLLDDDIAWLMAQWAKEAENEYHGEW